MLIDWLISLIINIWTPTEIGTLLRYIGGRITVDLKFNLYKDFWVLVLIAFFCLFIGGYYVQTTQSQWKAF